MVHLRNIFELMNWSKNLVKLLKCMFGLKVAN